MKIIVINGSPRRNGTTAILLNKVIEGAKTQGAATELVHLYDLNYKGCRGCLACSKRDGDNYGKCAIKDDLTPVFDKISETDAIILGSPIYMSSLTGESRSFLERLLWPYMGARSSGLVTRNIPTGLIYTMGASESNLNALGYQHFKNIESQVNFSLGTSESLFITNTWPLHDDYSKYFAMVINPKGNVEEEVKNRKEEFLNDCRKAFEMGTRIAQRFK